MNDIERCISEWVDRVNERDATIAALTKERDEAKEMQRSMYQGMANKLSELKPSHHPMYRAGVQEIIAAAFNGYQADKAQPVLLSEWQAQEICLAKLQAALDAEREKVKGLHEITKVICTHCCEPMEIPSKAVLQTQLTQLQALVRALPCFDGEIKVKTYHHESDRGQEWDEYECGDAGFDNLEAANVYAALLQYRATLDATTPAAKGANGE